LCFKGKLVREQRTIRHGTIESTKKGS